MAADRNDPDWCLAADLNDPDWCLATDRNDSDWRLAADFNHAGDPVFCNPDFLEEKFATTLPVIRRNHSLRLSHGSVQTIWSRDIRERRDASQ
jgi:hypothetical protein